METSMLLFILQYPLVSVLFVLLLGFTLSTLYSVYLSPLAKFPGPKLAAATSYYEFYYDVILKGQYVFRIKRMHEKYGPIVRISPHELHIDEPEYYEELFSQHKPRNKSQTYLNQFQLPGSTFGTADHKLHRMRRAAINPFFSKQSINRLEPMLTFMIDKLCGRIDEFQKSGQPMEMRRAYMCLTTDIVTLYALNKCWNHLDSPVFSTLWLDTIKAMTIAGLWLKHFPWVMPLTRMIPRAIVRKVDPGITLLLEWQDKIQENTRAVIDGKFKYSQEQSDLGLNKTIFHALLETNLPPEEKKFSRLWQEAQIVIGAGADTTGNALTITQFHILDNPDIHKRLREELVAAWPNASEPAQLKVVEKLPYLNAVIQEGLRFAYGVTSRLQRIDPTAPMKFHDFVIPAGTSVGMTSVFMHMNPAIFPEPEKFRPERWFENRPEGAPALDRYLVVFSKGSRQCVGINLARAELHLTLATVFRRYENQKLFETTRSRDIDLKHDFFLPSPSLESKGVRITY